MRISLSRLTLGGLLTGLAVQASAQSVYPVRGYSLVWDPVAKQGQVRINADSDRKAEEVIKVQSVAELNAWSTFLSTNDVRIRVSGGTRLIVVERSR